MEKRRQWCLTEVAQSSGNDFRLVKGGPGACLRPRPVHFLDLAGGAGVFLVLTIDAGNSLICLFAGSRHPWWVQLSFEKRCRHGGSARPLPGKFKH